MLCIGQWLAELVINPMSRPCKLSSFSHRFTLVCIGSTVAVAAAFGETSGPPSGPDSKIELCRAIKDDTARLRCYEEATSKPPANAPPQVSSPPQTLHSGAGTWPLVRTPNPAGGRDAVSIMQTADTTKSDLDLAGLMIRCGEADLESLVVLVSPLPPRASPKVTLSAGGSTEEFTGTLLMPPGAAILLPPGATALLSGPWKAVPELSLQVEGKPDLVKGVIPLAGLGASLPMLVANCSSQ
jgi:hypothetical protein